MFENRTLIVVGAGASSECNLPIGRELKKRIATLLDIRFERGYEQSSGDYEICEAFRAHAQAEFIDLTINRYLIPAWRIRDAMPQAISIDNYIDCHQGDKKLELCGKLAIVRSILEAERNSSLYVDPRERERRLNFEALTDTWFTAFMQLLTENCRWEQLAERLSRLTFVIFNYDRCVEHYVFHGLQNYYGVNEQQAAEMLKNLSVFHPYGTVGGLPWGGGTTQIGFGESPSTSQLLELVRGIKTFSEGSDVSASDVNAIRRSISDATILLFLGFAFHKMNLSLLKPDKAHTDPKSVRYLGTAKGMSKSDCDLVVNDLAELAGALPEKIYLRNDLTCASYFSEHWRSLSL